MAYNCFVILFLKQFKTKDEVKDKIKKYHQILWLVWNQPLESPEGWNIVYTQLLIPIAYITQGMKYNKWIMK